MQINRGILNREKQYITKLLKNINRNIEIDLTKDNLYIQEKNVLIKNDAIISLIDAKQYAYIGIGTSHLNFKQIDKEKALTIQGLKEYRVNFNAEVVGDKNVEVHMIAYNSSGEKLDNYPIIKVNEETCVSFSKNSHYLQLFMRVTGNTIIKNATFKVSLAQSIQEFKLETQSQVAISYEENNIPINVHDYDKDDVLTLENIEAALFNDQKAEIKINHQAIQVQRLKQATYVSLFEENTNFNILPQNNIISVDPTCIYDIQVEGETEVGLKVHLFVILYSTTKKEEVYQIALGQKNTITPSNNIAKMRLALRIEGEGLATIDTVKIQKQKKIEFIGYNNMKLLGYDVPEDLKDIRMACIFDEFTTECYRYSCDLMPITPYDWKAQFTVKKPHLLMVESAWVGNQGAWARKVAYTNDNNIKELRELIEWCKANNIPTVFWNKEDPVHYHVFINTAKMFDYIFTTDENKVKDYKKDAQNENVYALPFAAQPKIHNPIKIRDERDARACFAGSYYAARYPERQEDINRLLDAAVENMGIEIYDRKFGTTDKDFLFPERFRQYIKGSLKPYELHIANKGYKVMINVNSVKESPTMFSRRVFEGLACGTPVVSSYSEGINCIFEGLVVASDEREVLDREFRALNDEALYYDTKSIKGIRQVLTQHTYDHRLNTILSKIGLNVNKKIPLIDVVIEVDEMSQIEQAKLMYTKQNYANKKLTLIIPADSQFTEAINQSATENIRYIIKDYYAENKENMAKLFDGDFVAYLDFKTYYGKNYLNDLALATLYCPADIIGKAAYYNEQIQCYENEEAQYVYTSDMEMDKCIIGRAVLNEVGVDEFLEGLKEEHTQLFRRGYRMFAIDKFNVGINCGLEQRHNTKVEI